MGATSGQVESFMPLSVLSNPKSKKVNIIAANMAMIGGTEDS